MSYIWYMKKCTLFPGFVALHAMLTRLRQVTKLTHLKIDEVSLNSAVVCRAGVARETFLMVTMFILQLEAGISQTKLSH